MITSPTLVTREAVKTALDYAETSRSNDQVDNAIETATQNVESLLRRRLFPWTGTKYFPWPDRRGSSSWRLWLDHDDLISVTTLTAGGTTISASDYFLEPVNEGPPYTHIEVDRSTSSVFQAGDTGQRSVAVTGTWGYQVTEESVGSLAGTLAALPNATASVTWTTARIGVGSLLNIDSEYMVITDRTMVDSTQSLQTPLTASASNVTVAVSDGTAFAPEVILLLDSERMRVVDVSGNNLAVKRAYDGSVLASHSGSSIYTLTGVTLGRAVQGTTIASHSSSTDIGMYVVPAPARDLAKAYALNQLLQERSGYARVAGSGDNQREVSGRGIREIEKSALLSCGRQLLKGVV